MQEMLPSLLSQGAGGLDNFDLKKLAAAYEKAGAGAAAADDDDIPELTDDAPEAAPAETSA
jgi:hypothetical protein